MFNLKHAKFLTFMNKFLFTSMIKEDKDKKMYPKWESSAVEPDIATGGKYEDYRQDDVLADLLKGRRIAFVCPSPHLNGMGLGKYIDEFDLVVRVGTVKPVPERLWEDCGRRTDIVIHSFNQFEIGEAYANIDYLGELRYVMCCMASTDWVGQHDHLIQKLRGMGTPAQNVNDGYLYRMFKEVGTVCNVGFAGLLTLLHYDLKEIFVAGMGFYNMGNYGIVYNSDYYQQVTEKMKIFQANEQRIITAEDARADLHRQQPQIDHMRKLLWRDKRITVDQYLKDNLVQDVSYIKDQDLYIDIDGILCVSKDRFASGPYEGEFNYEHSTPLIHNIDLVNELYQHNRITIWTARGKRTGKIDWSEFTIKQLEAWGVNYHEIRFDKPHFDLLWDDKSAFDKKTFVEQLNSKRQG
jgi:hypothetical protein